MRLDRPSGGYDDPPERRDKPVVYDRPRETDRPREAGEGTGWPADRKPEKPKTPQEQIDELKSKLRSTQQELGKTRYELDETKRHLRKAETARDTLTDTNSRLTKTNSELTSTNMELRKETGRNLDLYDKIAKADEQRQAADSKPHRHNWFPTDKMGAVGGAVAGVAGTYGELAGRVSSKEEAFGVACAGAGIAVVGLGREMMDKVNDWRDKRAEKKNAG